MESNTKENILRAAIKIFARKGYKSATIREIGSEAGAANLSAIAYHFKGKENLYKAVLEFMFEDANKFIPIHKSNDTEPTPEEKLKHFIFKYMQIIYVLDTELDSDMASIFSKEVTHPSPFLNEMVQKYIVPGGRELQNILFDIIGSKTPFDMIRKCEDSIMGQVYYQLFAWPLISGSYPDEPPAHKQIKEKAHHIYLFTMGGVAEIKKSLHK